MEEVNFKMKLLNQHLDSNRCNALIEFFTSFISIATTAHIIENREQCQRNSSKVLLHSQEKLLSRFRYRSTLYT